MAHKLYALVGPAVDSSNVPAGAFGLVPPNHECYKSLVLFANPAPPGYVATHPEHIRESIAKVEAELIRKYDSALKSAQDLLLKKQQEKGKKKNTTEHAELKALKLTNEKQLKQIAELTKQLEEHTKQIEAQKEYVEQLHLVKNMASLKMPAEEATQ